MAEANADMNMDKETNEGLNLSMEERNFVPRDMGQPHLHTSAGATEVLNPEQERMIPPIKDLNLGPTHTHHDDMAGPRRGNNTNYTHTLG